METFPNKRCPKCKSPTSFDYYGKYKGIECVWRYCVECQKNSAYHIETGRLLEREQNGKRMHQM